MKDSDKLQPTLQQRNSLARVWLRNRDLFNVAALCRRIDYDRGNFSRFLSGHQELGAESLDLLEEALMPYGYQSLK